MKKQSESLIKGALEIQADLNSLTVDQINREAPKAIEQIPQEMSLKERAKLEGARYVEPKRLSPPLGKLPESLKKEHNHAWEYVKGIYENYVVTGEPLTFSYSVYPGDADYMWTVPANVPVYVPRFIAKHLEECQAYHTFNYVEKNSSDWKTNDQTHQFKVTGTTYRGKFRPIGAFA